MAPAVGVPFAISLASAGELAVTEAGPGAGATFRVNAGRMLAQVSSIATGQAAARRIARVGDTLYASNAGNGTLSDVRDAPGEPPPLLGTVATGSGTVDDAASRDGYADANRLGHHAGRHRRQTIVAG
jgi:hypothetical protein